MLQRISDIQSVILKGIAILLASVLCVYAVLSIWGNIALNRAENPETGFPSKRSAPYQFTIATTGQFLFAKKYETIEKSDPQVYSLPSGYYTMVDKKAVFIKSPLDLDERLWGEIVVKRR